MKKVFFIDDDAFVTQVYHHLLQAEGIQVSSANSGAQAIERLHAENPDLVVLDLHMPGIDGVDVLRFIRGDGQLKNLPVIVFSNGYLRELVAEVGDLAVKKIIAKLQCTPKQLIEEIKAFFAEQSNAAENDAAAGRIAETPQSELPRLLELLSGTPSPQTQRRCLIQIKKIMHNTFQRAKAMGERSPANQLTNALKALLDDLHAHPDHVSESTVKTLAQGLKKLQTLCAKTSNPQNSPAAPNNTFFRLGD